MSDRAPPGADRGPRRFPCTNQRVRYFPRPKPPAPPSPTAAVPPPLSPRGEMPACSQCSAPHSLVVFMGGEWWCIRCAVLRARREMPAPNPTSNELEECPEGHSPEYSCTTCPQRGGCPGPTVWLQYRVGTIITNDANTDRYVLLKPLRALEDEAFDAIERAIAEGDALLIHKLDVVP